MNKCTRALAHTCVNEFSCQSQAPAYYFSSPGPSRAVCCVSMSKSDLSFDIAKLRTKKTRTKHFNETTWMAEKPFGQQ